MTGPGGQEIFKVGDPDPTAGATTTPCAAVVVASALGDEISWPEPSFICTRVRGHSGAHVAGTGRVIVAVWDSDAY